MQRTTSQDSGHQGPRLRLIPSLVAGLPHLSAALCSAAHLTHRHERVQAEFRQSLYFRELARTPLSNPSCELASCLVCDVLARNRHPIGLQVHSHAGIGLCRRTDCIRPSAQPVASERAWRPGAPGRSPAVAMHTYQHRGVWQSRSGVNADRVGAGRRLLGLAFRHCIDNATDTVPASHRLMYAGARTIVPPKSATRGTQEHRAKSYESTSSDRASVCSSAPVCREPCPLLGEREVQVQFDSRYEVLEVQSGQERRVHGVGRRHSFTEMCMGLSTELSSNTGLHGAAGTALLGLQVVHGKLNAQ